MYSQNQHSGMNRLHTEQRVSLDKHQKMINHALKWQEHMRVVADDVDTEPKRKSLPHRLKRVALVIAQLLVK